MVPVPGSQLNTTRASYEAAEGAAERIPGARFASLETGGLNLLLGQTGAIQRELASFLSPASAPDRLNTANLRRHRILADRSTAADSV